MDRIRVLEMLVIRKILHSYLMDGPLLQVDGCKII